MRDDFQQFKPSVTGGSNRGANKSKEALASVNGSGCIRFNPAAMNQFDLSSDTYVLLFYSKSRKIIGMKISTASDIDAVKFYNRKNSGEGILGIRPFMESAGLPNITQRRRRMSMDKETGMILIHDVKDKETADFEAAVNRSEVTQ